MNSSSEIPASAARDNHGLEVISSTVNSRLSAVSTRHSSGPLRRFAQETLPQQQSFLEYAKRLAGGR